MNNLESKNKPPLGFWGLIKQMSFTLCILLAVAIGMFFPQYFQKIGDFKFTSLIVPLIQLIMFSMGTEMSLKDFEGVIKTPKAVLIGLVCHFTIMPLVGFILATSFGFPPEIAAGVILMGSVPSGVSSNVLAFIAKANLPLSITHCHRFNFGGTHCDPFFDENTCRAIRGSRFYENDDSCY
jgi:bile acid:Na+ symporter, BASS family